MCLAIPGEVLSLYTDEGGLPCARVQFGSIIQQVCIAYTPEVQPGEYLVVHVGFAIQILDQAAAQQTLELLTADEIPSRVS